MFVLLVLTTIVSRHSLIHSEKPLASVNNKSCESNLCSAANIATIQRPSYVGDNPRGDPHWRGPRTRRGSSQNLGGLHTKAVACAVGSLPSRESGCFMPTSKPRKRVFRFPLRRPKKSENRPDCAACACRAKPGWDVYAVDLEDGEILLFRSNESLERAQKAQANLEPGYRDHVLIVWPHAYTLFPDGMEDE